MEIIVPPWSNASYENPGISILAVVAEVKILWKFSWRAILKTEI